MPPDDETGPASGRRRGRRLKREERELWTLVTRSIAPLQKPVAEPEPEPPPSPSPAPPPAPAKRRVAAPVKPATPKPEAKPQPAPAPPALDRRARQRLARGRTPIDGRIDLHGRTQAEAHDALLGFLERSRSGGARTVLVITGKGRLGEAEAGRGVLRRQVPLWLSLPAFRALVIGFDEAGPGHGGAGALYVRLRRSGGD